jgi:KaiC/GvpD/RAD55 family RecA-like ATPase
MRLKDVSAKLRTFQGIEAILRQGPLVTAETDQNSFALLIAGLPGVGKTTVGLFLLNWLYRKRRNSAKAPLMLSLVENGEQLDRICSLFGFHFRDGEAPVLPVHVKGGEEPNLKELARVVGLTLEPGDLVFVDGISVLGTEAGSRGVLRAFIDQIRRERLAAILVAEEYSVHGDMYLDYAVDGIIRLGLDTKLSAERGIAPRRRFEIAKLRWHDYVLGPHAFRLQSRPATGASDHMGVRFFPSAACLISGRLRGERRVQAMKSYERWKEQTLGSGVDGFDTMVSGHTADRDAELGAGASLAHTPGAFRIGDAVLLLGPSGSGKFLFGVQFLGAATKDERAVFLSFARSIDSLRSRFDSLPEAGPASLALHLDVTEMTLEEMLGAVHNLLEEHEPKVTRLFVHGLSTLRLRFADEAQYESFFRSLLTLIGTFPSVTALVSYNTSRVFASYAEIDIPVSDAFSTIVGFNFQEQYNRLVHGIVILKSHAAKYDASLKVPEIENGTYRINTKEGWAKVALLSGDRERVHEERPFVKLFFENKSDQEVLRGPFDEFRARYPGSTEFQMVGKHNPQPSHWSFRGYFGPGHSNTKLVQLRKYVLDELRDDDRLVDVPHELTTRLAVGQPDYFSDRFLWRDCTATTESDVRQMLPAYADVGVLVYQDDALGADIKIPRTWEELGETVDRFKALQETSGTSKRHLFVIPNTVGDYRNFVAFFFELCWTCGWDFPSDGACADRAMALNALMEWVDGDYFTEAVDLLLTLVDRGKPDIIPNPVRGGHYHESVFSRRWFSKIHLLPEDADARAISGQPGLRFGIAPLPGVNRRNGKVLPGISNVDLYALGVIRGALAPETAWMLVTSLFERDLDTSRAKRKRGLPISRTKFNTRLVQDNLKAVPISPAKSSAEVFYEGMGDLFNKYGETLNLILGQVEEDTQQVPAVHRFKRTSDIPRFFHVEACLAKHLPRIFATPRMELAKIRSDIKQDLRLSVYPSNSPRT